LCFFLRIFVSSRQFQIASLRWYSKIRCKRRKDVTCQTWVLQYDHAYTFDLFDHYVSKDLYHCRTKSSEAYSSVWVYTYEKCPNLSLDVCAWRIGCRGNISPLTFMTLICTISCTHFIFWFVTISKLFFPLNFLKCR